jgi:hypothetical protein
MTDSVLKVRESSYPMILLRRYPPGVTTADSVLHVQELLGTPSCVGRRFDNIGREL